ncbi:tRNA 2-selenouridine(34) synthase MnmH [Helicobacter enhydrae]|uniref:tRNA 2-selenouridine(34) synthase MnmH n=1 Tax=Helicobacter enhydrae TaxID=222136 RepID=A0A1B1U5D2_9HELI|nr:tRNA 2-selenouridine(34) synthase MnmH [Helicobacter enhydrae]ANV97966.1 tRNA 2-selenouridine(34) synthase MnmH [Helicobacter enhydrae]
MRQSFLLDVRSPKEYNASHIPTALNYPVLNDWQYAEIGSLYHQDALSAKKQGSVYVCQNIARYLQEDLIFHPKNKIVLYCARGGQRSRSFWHILKEIGFDCERLDGGYKSYRTKVVKALQTPPRQTFLTLYGMTGCGKSDLIALNDSWSIDIEGLSKHYGSSFGDQSNGFLSQPSGAMFENSLFEELARKEGLVLVEGESKKLGKIVLPSPFFEAVHRGRKILVSTSMPKRVERIVKMYHTITPEQFTSSMHKIRPYIHKKYFVEVLEAYDRGDLERVAWILLEKYYDCVYRQQQCEFEVFGDDLQKANMQIASIYKELAF